MALGVVPPTAWTCPRSLPVRVSTRKQVLDGGIPPELVVSSSKVAAAPGDWLRRWPSVSGGCGARGAGPLRPVPRDRPQQVTPRRVGRRVGDGFEESGQRSGEGVLA